LIDLLIDLFDFLFFQNATIPPLEGFVNKGYAVTSFIYLFSNFFFFQGAPTTPLEGVANKEYDITFGLVPCDDLLAEAVGQNRVVCVCVCV